MRKQNTYTLAQVRDYDSRPLKGRNIDWKKELLVWSAICLLGGDNSVKAYEVLTCAFGAWLVWDKLMKRRSGIALTFFRGFLMVGLLMIVLGTSFHAIGGLILLITAGVWGCEFWKNKK